MGHHFARPGNRFWKALHGSGFTERLLSPFEERELLELGVGITNLVDRSTAAAGELSAVELMKGGRRLESKVCRFRPRFVAFLGLTAYRTSFDRRFASSGPQGETLCGSRVWLLPNPSGLNAYYQMPELVAEFRKLRDATAGRSAG